ncbi:MAG TPA: GNAT family N-acetyltransferase [Chloroflexota bacterium]|nr:GNAT family N-acetyltransferase [Chloroflexota bacterium]
MTSAMHAAGPTWEIRPMGSQDEANLVHLWNETLVRDPITLDAFRRQTLLSPNFDPAGCLVAHSGDGAAVGFVLAIPHRTAGLHAGARGTAHIAGLGVLPAARRQGLGALLLDAALTFLRGRECARVTVAAHEYYAAGVDADAYPEGIAFLVKRGFHQTGEATAMGRLLYDLEWPSEVRDTERRLLADGIEVAYFQPNYTRALAAYFAAEFPDWIEFFTRKLDAGATLDEIVIALDTRSHQVIGYCQHLDTDHVGPFGVARAYRNRGLGSVMLYRLLERMRQKGYRFAWFGETGRARPYYERAGFFTTRRYALLERSL